MLKNIISVLVALGAVILCLLCFVGGQVRGERSVGREMNALAALEQAVLEFRETQGRLPTEDELRDRKSTRLNSSHGYISYAVFCYHRDLHSFPTRRSSDLCSRT